MTSDQVIRRMQADRERTELHFTWGRTDAMRDRFEQVPFASIGGLDRRDDPAAPSYVGGDECDQANYLTGYVSYSKEVYGENWRTVKFNWEPVLVVNSKEK